MAEILGAGVTHYPPMVVSDEERAFPLKMTLARDERVPEHMKNPANWPEPMRVEYGEDEGVASAVAHRERLVKSFRVINDEIQAFEPDFVLIFGDDQYENFRETIIPPFCILAYEESESAPFQKRFSAGMRNAWDEPEDKVFRYRGHPEAARWLTTQLIEQGVDMAYAYKPLHDPGLPHSILNTLLFLDYDRRGVRHSGGAFRSQLLRQQGHQQPGRHPASQGERQVPGAGPAGAFAQALYAGGCGDGPGASGLALARGAGGVVKLVARLSDGEEPFPLARH